MHRHQDIAPSHELVPNVQLRYRRPVGVFFETWSEISQNMLGRVGIPNIGEKRVYLVSALRPPIR